MHGLYFFDTKGLGEIPRESPPTWAPNAGGVAPTSTILDHISETVQDRDIVIMER